MAVDYTAVMPVFLELKSREGFASTKRRQQFRVSSDRLMPARWGEGILPRSVLVATLAGFGYFSVSPLCPVLRISYWRYRFVEIATGSRVALDCRIRASMTRRELGHGETDLELPGAVIEIKGTSLEVPGALKQLKVLDLDWTRFSKYAACIEAHLAEPGSVARMSPLGRVL